MGTLEGKPWIQARYDELDGGRQSGLNIVGKRVQELSCGVPRGGQKSRRTAVCRTENKELILDLVWKVTCLLVCHDGSIPRNGSRNASSIRWEFACCIADLATAPDDCGPSV
jgi:hypothetical protein